MSKGKIGFIGLGIMGSRMASNLVEAGYDVDVWNRSRMKGRPLEEKGSRFLSPAELAAESDVLITMLAHPQAVSETMLGENGVLSSMKPGTLWIDTSTVPPSFSAKESEEARRREERCRRGRGNIQRRSVQYFVRRSGDRSFPLGKEREDGDGRYGS